MPWRRALPDQLPNDVTLRLKGTKIMLALLTAAALSLAPHALETHHDYRLATSNGPQAARTEKDCRATEGMVVCANRAKAQLRWRITSDDLDAQDSAKGHHVTALRTQHLRCANPVEDGLRCVKPVPARSFALGN